MIEARPTTVAVYNPLSGNGRARRVIESHLKEITNSDSVRVCDLGGLGLQLAQIGESEKRLIAIYGGDGTQASVLSQVWKLIKEGLVSEEQVVCCLMGNNGSGGERVMAKILGTNNRTLAQILTFLNQNWEEAVLPLRPHFLKVGKDKTHNLWWHYASGGGIVERSLAEIEKLRLEGDKYHLSRSLRAALRILQTFRYQREIEAKIGTEQKTVQELAYLIPPFLALSRLHLPPQDQATVMTVTSEGLEWNDFVRQTMWGLMGLAVVGSLRCPTVALHSISPGEQVQGAGAGKNYSVDSELKELGGEVVVFQQPECPSVKVVKIRQ